MTTLAVWWTVWLFHPRCTDDDDDGDDGCDDDDDDDEDDDDDDDDDVDDDDDDTSWLFFNQRGFNSTSYKTDLDPV